MPSGRKKRNLFPGGRLSKYPQVVGSPAPVFEKFVVLFFLAANAHSREQKHYSTGPPVIQRSE